MLQKMSTYIQEDREGLLKKGAKHPLKFYGKKILLKIISDDNAWASLRELLSDAHSDTIYKIEEDELKVRKAYTHEMDQIMDITNFAYFSRYRTKGKPYENLVNVVEFTNKNDEVFVCVYGDLILSTVKASYNGSIEVHDIFNLQKGTYAHKSEIGEFKRLAAHPILDILSQSEDKELAEKAKKLKVLAIKKVWYRAFESMKKKRKSKCIAIFCQRVIEFFKRENIGVFERVDKSINKNSNLYQRLLLEYDVYWTDSPHAYQMLS
jgi:hypothetical protein